MTLQKGKKKKAKNNGKKKWNEGLRILFVSFILLTTVLMAWTKPATLDFALHPNYNTINASYWYLSLMYIFNF